MISSVPVSVMKVSRVFLKVPRRKEKQNSVNKVKFFIFFAHKNDSRIYSWTTDVTWTILTMFLLHFWALNVVVVLLSMKGQKALGCHQKYLNLFPKMNEGLKGWDRHEGE